VRARRAPEAKASIARRAAGLIADGQLVILDGGTTAVEVARALRPDLRATVVTTSPPVAVALSEHRSVEIAVVGGSLRRDSLVAVGAETVDALRMIRADVAMLGVCGLHPQIGVTANDLEETQTKRAMIESAAAVVALADHDKLGTAMPVVVAQIEVITQLVTDSDVDDQMLAPYRAAGIEVLYA
jgi:DeoR/GlpR family transcriptional regulator of sugar metabolism